MTFHAKTLSSIISFTRNLFTQVEYAEIFRVGGSIQVGDHSGIADELLLPREGTGIHFEAHWISDAGDALSYSR